MLKSDICVDLTPIFITNHYGQTGTKKPLRQNLKGLM
jgi:hypothetical protein